MHWRNKETRGLLSSEDQIQGWIDTHAQKKRSSFGPTKRDVKQDKGDFGIIGKF